MPLVPVKGRMTAGTAACSAEGVWVPLLPRATEGLGRKGMELLDPGGCLGALVATGQYAEWCRGEYI